MHSLFVMVSGSKMEQEAASPLCFSHYILIEIVWMSIYFITYTANGLKILLQQEDIIGCNSCLARAEQGIPSHYHARRRRNSSTQV
jgi:hypothetical protein